MPLVVAVVGIIGTYWITKEQGESARTASAAQIEAAQKAADADRQIKVLEIFSEKIASNEQDQRILALRILGAVEPDLATKLATAVAESEPVGSKVKETAQQVATETSALIPAKIYIHFPTEAVKREALLLKNQLESRGFTVPSVASGAGDNQDVSQLRYFRKAEAQEAAQIAELLRTMGIRVDLRYMVGFETALSARPRQYGLWLGTKALPN